MRFPIGALICILIAGICFFVWTGFNYAFFGEGNIQEALWDAGNKTMSGDRKTDFGKNMAQMKDGFGLFGVLLIGIAVFLFVVDVMRKPPGDMY